ncbi:NUDIX pyrophosphatase [Candidatus Peregrinibacteria bacterium]|jgi:dihydroneopterin triphosphate diphosphatase|nr:NUDIX pyrophosphatase [Candidatus Peregrinibacteria bacterium]MBT7483440.1 NUDIX pyrophosphatase [Candidatus Peregrinibacteria bacterium]MBT7702668.1 NUDIX pyrophosphatase [Candidatus Peregrinibacteria bacterium]
MSDGRIAQVEVIIFKIIDEKPVFLLLKRQLHRGGFWQPVTGGVEKGEDLKETALREMKEETGIENYVEVLEDLHYFEFEANGGHGWMKEYVFGVQVDEKTESVISDEHSEQKWCSLDEALDLLKYENNKVGFRKISYVIAA